MSAVTYPWAVAPVLPRARTRRLFVGTATLVAAVAFAGFTPSYWVPFSRGTLDLHPAVHVHAALFFLWTLFFLAQTTLVARGRTGWHRELGLFGIALAALMVFSGVLATIISLKANIPGPRAETARAVAAAGFSAMFLFTTFMALAIANVRRADTHKRLMVLANFAIVPAALVRLIRLVPIVGQSDVRILIGAVIIDLVLLAVVLLDRRATGRVHPAWIVGGAFLVTVQFSRVPLVNTDLWTAFTDWIARM